MTQPCPSHRRYDSVVQRSIQACSNVRSETTSPAEDCSAILRLLMANPAPSTTDGQDKMIYRKYFKLIRRPACFRTDYLVIK